ncbi:hypothetical protein QCA50_009044 [Cerrena zonata]|uniref:Uncharacterized protein n=1 Tax=Cerrena zonata TaxID=2478898 RepID=A0AAW0G2V7_9APHY
MHTRTPSVDLASLSELFSRLASGGKSVKPGLTISPPLPKSRTSSIGSLPDLCASPTSTCSNVSLRTISDESDASSSEDDVSSYVPPSPLTTRGRTAERVFNRGKSKVVTTPNEDKDFTFKLMLHDIYGTTNFVDMVQGVIQESKKTYRPLPENMKPKPRREFLKRRDLERDADDEESPERVVEVPQTPTKPRYPEDLGLGTPVRSERAAKKRCVGRTRSGREPQPMEIGCVYELDSADEKDPAYLGDVSVTISPLKLRPTRKLRESATQPPKAVITSIDPLSTIDVFATTPTSLPFIREGGLEVGEDN